MAQHASADVAGAQTQVALLAGHLRLDLAIPAHVPLIEVLPDVVDLARRAGAGPGVAALRAGDVTLVEVGGGPLRNDATLAEQDVRDGALLMLLEPGTPTPLTLHHDVAGAVADVVEREHLQVDDATRRRAVAGTTLVAGALLVTTLLNGATAPVVAATVALAVAVLAGVGVRRLPAKVPDAELVAVVGWLAYAPLAGLLWGQTWALQAGADPSLAGGVGAAVGAALSVLLLSWAEPGRREWALVPVILGVCVASAVLVSRIEFSGASMAVPDVLSAIVVLLVLAVAPLVAGTVQATAVRGAAEDTAPVAVQALSERVATAVRCVLALDVAVLLLALWMTQHWIARGGAGLAVWGSVVLLLWARTRGERLRVRHRLGLSGAALVAVWGTVLWARFGQGSEWSGTVTVCVLVGVLAATWTHFWVGSVWARRPVAIGERVLRLALPSLWLLSSGLLPGWPR